MRKELSGKVRAWRWAASSASCLNHRPVKFPGIIFEGREPIGAEQIDNLIAESVAGLMPVIAGEIAAVAVRAALAGDEAAIEDMAARMEAELEQELEQRGREIEARAEALCLRVAELDQIESGLSASILDGKPLNLIEFDSVR